MPDSDDKNKKSPPANLLGSHDYQFFVHNNFTTLDYQFTHSPTVAETGQAGTANISGVKTNTIDAIRVAAAVGNTDKQIIDRFGALITYPLWQILPSTVKFANGTLVDFEYDTMGDVNRILEVPGSEWRRGSAGQNKLHTWSRSDGKTFTMQVFVMPDGNYQMLHQNGIVETYTTEGKLLVGRPFPPKFDLQQSLVRVFRQLDKGSDGLLSKDELNAGVSLKWKNDDDAQLVTMLKLHFELIQLLRNKALLKLGKGLSMDDVHNYDASMRSRFSPLPSPECLKTIDGLFNLVDTDNDENVSLSELQEKSAQMKLTAGQRASLNFLISNTEKLHAFTSNGYVNRVERMTKNEFLAHYSDVYREQIGMYASAGGWGIEKVWRKTLEAKRTLYADSSQPLKSVKVEAIKQGAVGDCLFLSALASVITVRPDLLVNCISENENDTYTVTFAGADDVPIAVGAPTSSELALYAKGSAYGIWAPLMEKAYGMLVAKRRNLHNVIPAENTATRENMKSLDILTGNKSRWEYTQDSFSRALGSCSRTIGENELRTLLSTCFRRKLAIIAASLKPCEPENGEPLIVGMHAYSIIGWNAQRDEVLVRNPWGIVPLNASHMDLFRFEFGTKLQDDGTEGIFKLPLVSFYNKFEALCIESPPTETN